MPAPMSSPNDLLAMSGPPDDGGPLAMISKIIPHVDPDTKAALMSNPQAIPQVMAKAADIRQQLLQGQPAPPKGMGSQKKTTVGNSSGTEATQVQRDPMQIQNAIANMANTPQFKSADVADQMTQERLNALQDQSSNAWIKPLSALADSVNGTNLAASAPDPQARNAMLLKYQDDLDKRKQEMFKSLASSAAQFKTGSAIEKQNQTYQNMSGYGYGSGTLNSRLARIPIAAGQDFDKQTAGATRSIESFNKGDSLLSNPGVPMTENSLNMIQQDISAGLTATGVATDSKLAMDMQHTIQGIIQQAKAKWTGNFDPDKDDLRKVIPDIANQIQKVLHNVRGDYSDSINRQIDQIGKTYEPSFDAIPNLRETVEGKQAQMRARFPKSKDYSQTGAYAGPVYPGIGGAPAAAAAGAGAAPTSKPKTVVQNGHTYTLNANGEYE